MTALGFDPLHNKSYRATTLGRDVADFLAWKELGGASPRTLDQYERDLARGALMFPDKTVGDLEDGDALHIAKVFKPAERRVRVAAWRSFYKWARQTRRAANNPFDALPTIKRQPKRVYDIFTESEREALCALPIRDGALMAVMFETGARKGDCRRLQLKHFIPDPAPGAFRFFGGKGGHDRLVDATIRVAQSVSELAIVEGLNPDDHLWYSVRANEISRKIMRKTPVGEGTFARWWRDCLEQAGVRYRNPHMTRHTYATWWLQRGGRLETLSKQLGHARSSTTQDEYIHLERSDVLADLAVIEGRA